MSSPIFESLQMPLEVPALTAGAKCKKSKSGQRRIRNRDTNKCRLPCPSYCRPPLSDEEKAQRKDEKLEKRLEELDKEAAQIQEERSKLGVARPGAGAGGGSPQGGYYQFSGGEIEGGEIEGGARHKRKMTKYNMFVKKYAASHRNMSGKSLIKSAAKSWNKCKRSGSRSCSPRRR